MSESWHFPPFNSALYSAVMHLQSSSHMLKHACKDCCVKILSSPPMEFWPEHPALSGTSFMHDMENGGGADGGGGRGEGDGEGGGGEGGGFGAGAQQQSSPPPLSRSPAESQSAPVPSFQRAATHVSPATSHSPVQYTAQETAPLLKGRTLKSSQYGDDGGKGGEGVYTLDVSTTSQTRKLRILPQ